MGSAVPALLSGLIGAAAAALTRRLGGREEVGLHEDEDVDPVGKLHSAEARLRMLQVFPSMMLSTVDTTRLCDLFRTELATLFDASEVFVYLEVFDIMPPSHRSATAVVMKEGNAISLSQKHSHPDVRLEAHERTVLAVPICAHNKFTDVSSSFSDLLSGAVVGCVEVVNRRAGTNKEEDVRLLSALSVVLCDAVNRAVELKDAWHSSTRTPHTQVEFFGETTIIPDKSRPERRRNTLHPGQLHAMVPPGGGMSPRALRRSLDVLRDPSDSAVRNCTGAESVGVGREWDTSTSRSTSTSADHKGDQLYANQQCGRAVTTRCFCGVTCNCDPPTEEDWTDVFNPRSRSKSYQHVGVNPTLSCPTLTSGEAARAEEMIDCIDGDDFPLQTNPQVLHDAHAMDLLDCNFDVLQYSRPQLVDLAVLVFEYFNLLESFKISRETLHNFVTSVLNLYHDTPFHNYQHAFHVFQNCMLFLSNIPELLDSLTSLDAFSLLVAALCHDMDHTGTNNTYHINSWSQLAMRYNDVSVMEQHHSALCFKALTNPDANIVQALTSHSRSIVRKLICQAILSTDMNNHHKNLDILAAHRGVRFQKCVLNDRVLLVGTLLHTADLCNPCLSIEPAKEWEKRISHEFLFQSTLEVEHGLPVAPFMLKYDMLSRVVNQNHFMTAVAYPQWKTFVEVFPVMSARLDQLKLNIEYFFTLKKTLETYPELADPTCNDVSVKGDGLWDGELLRRHASQNWDGVPQRQASRTWHVVEDEPDKVTVMGGSLQGARGRRPSRRLSLLTQPGASALMLMWHAPQVLPDLYEMRKRGNLSAVDDEVKRYLWEELLPSGRTMSSTSTTDKQASKHALLTTAPVSRLPSSERTRRFTSLSVERVVDQAVDSRSRPSSVQVPNPLLYRKSSHDNPMAKTWGGRQSRELHIPEYKPRTQPSTPTASPTTTSSQEFQVQRMSSDFGVARQMSVTWPPPGHPKYPSNPNPSSKPQLP